MTRYIKIFTLLIALCCTGELFAQRPFMRDFWLNDANQPVKINTMLQDVNGYIWLGTDEGIYRFNGREVKNIKDTLHKPVTAFAQLGSSIIIGYKDGSLASYNDNIISPYVLKGKTPTSAISDMYVDGSGALWICTEGEGFFMVLNNIAIPCNTGSGLSDNFVYNLIVYSGKRVVASTDQGINEVYFENGKLKVNKFGTENGLPDNIITVIKPMPDNTACWVGMQEGGIAFYCRKTRQVWKPELDSAWKWGQVNDIMPLGKGKAWVATEDGYLLELTTGDLEQVHIRSHYFPGKKMRKLILGKSGILWCGTNTGLTMIADEYMLYLSLTEPYKLQELTAMTCDADNHIWFSLDKKLYTYSLQDKKPVPALRYTAPITIKSLYADKSGNLWVGTFGKGLYCLRKNGQVLQIMNIPSLQNETVLAISGYENSLWVSGLNGVAELLHPDANGGVLKLLRMHNKSSGAGSDYIYQIYPDHKGRIWMATDGAGITMYSDGKYKNFTAAEGLTSKVIYTITEDAVGRIWTSSLDNGLFWFDNKKWHQVGLQHGLRDMNVNTIAANASGQIVAVHNEGLDIWYPQSRQFRSYAPKQGIHIDSTSSVQKLFARDKTGNVYIPFEHGFIVVKNINPTYDIKPNVHIESVSIFFKPSSLNNDKLSHDQNHISFTFEGVNFANTDKLYYRYKLEGYSDSWIATNDESVTFPKLSPGKYTFRVQASLNRLFTNNNDATYSFTIALPFWRQWWFLILMGILVVGIAYAYITLREKNLKKLSSLQRERMMFEYEHLKSQVNPHFLFNSLNTLASLIEEDKALAAKYTTHLSDLYRNMLAHRNKDLVTLGEEWEILENYFYVQQSRFGDALKLEADIPAELMKTKKIIPLALQLLVENAIKHNVVSRSKPLIISIKTTEEAITIRNTFNPKISKEKGAGLGMANIKKRYSLLTNKNIYYGVSDKEYVVNLPLL